MTKDRRARLAGVLSVRGNATQARQALLHTNPPLLLLPLLSPLLPKPPQRLLHHNQHQTPLLHTLLLTPFNHIQHQSLPPTPIAAIPLATLRASSSPAPLERNKGAVLIPSDEDEDSVDGPVFKRRRTNAVATFHSSSHKHPTSLRDHPPSASLPQRYLALEEGAETAPEPTPTPVPEFPRVI